MKCPRCGHRNSRVKYTRSNVDPTVIYRRRKCLNPACEATFRTWETLDPKDACRGRRPGEPRRVRGRPRRFTSPSPIPPEPKALEQEPRTPVGVPADPVGVPPDWREKFAEAIKTLAACPRVE